MHALFSVESPATPVDVAQPSDGNSKAKYKAKYKRYKEQWARLNQRLEEEEEEHQHQINDLKRQLKAAKTNAKSFQDVSHSWTFCGVKLQVDFLWNSLCGIQMKWCSGTK